MTTTTKTSKMSKKSAEALKDRINERLAAPGGSREARLELCSLLESVLFEAGCYEGFGYAELNRELLREYNAFLAETVNAEYTEEYNAAYKRHYAAAFGDDSRRFYF